MVKIDVYLPLGSDYDVDLRDEYEYDESLSEDENREIAKERFISKYGFPTARRDGTFAGGSADARFKNQYEWRSSTKDSVVIEINGMIKKSVNDRYNRTIDERILQLTLEGLSLKEIQASINSQYDKDYSRYAIRDRRLRLQGKK